MSPESDIFQNVKALGNMKPGDRLARAIENNILGPIESKFPAALPLIDRARKCAGCKAAINQLNGGSDGGLRL